MQTGVVGSAWTHTWPPPPHGAGASQAFLSDLSFGPEATKVGEDREVSSERSSLFSHGEDTFQVHSPCLALAMVLNPPILTSQLQ